MRKVVTTSTSMRALVRSDKSKFSLVLDEYLPLFFDAFPDPDEREDRDTYESYVQDDDFQWDMIALHAQDGAVIGGIQYQELVVLGVKLIWAEHIWLATEARNYANFRSLLRIAQERWSATGAKFVFMEFNDRAKMTFAQLKKDAEGGLATESRETIWARIGLFVLCDSFGLTAPYWQSGMPSVNEAGESVRGEPVKYLTLGFAPLDGSDIDGDSFPVELYRELLVAAHSTIPGVDPETDEAIQWYLPQLQERINAGETSFRFVKLADTVVARMARTRFAAKKDDNSAAEPVAA